MRRRTWVVAGAAAVTAGVIAYVTVDAPPPGPGDVTGRYQAYDDTGMRTRPIGKGVFLVLPGTTVHDVWPEAEAGLRQYPDFAPATLDVDELVDAHGGRLVEVQPDGQFRIDVPEGPAVVCLMGIRTLNGCVDVELSGSESVEARFGEGGFHVE